MDITTSIWSIQSNGSYSTKDECRAVVGLQFINKGESEAEINGVFVLEQGESLTIPIAYPYNDCSEYKVVFKTAGVNNLIVIIQTKQ